MGNRHPIGLGHLGEICQLREQDKLCLLEAGLPVVLASAEGFLAGAKALRHLPREADVLVGFAAEEAAKALILIDMLRCPAAQRAEKAGTFVRWFYSHLARLIYAEAVRWRPTDKSELRRYVEVHRRSHSTDGLVGEFIVPSGPVQDRERLLYADVERSDDGRLIWNAPRSWKEGQPDLSIFHRDPEAVSLSRAMQSLGMFSMAGLQTIADIWSAEPLSDAMTWQDSQDLTARMLGALEGKGGIPDEASDSDSDLLLNNWPLPMWDFDLALKVIPLEDLEVERDNNVRGSW